MDVSNYTDGAVEGQNEEDNSDPEDYVPHSPANVKEASAGPLPQPEASDDICTIRSLNQQWFSWILVSGVPRNVSKYTLTLLFEDPSQGFGLPVKEAIIDNGRQQARVEFENAVDAETVLRIQRLSGSVFLSNSELTFSRYIPPPIEHRKLLVTNLPADMTDARLKFILSQKSACTMVLIGTRNSAIIGFQKLSDKAQIEKQLKNMSPVVEVHPVEVSSYILVEGFSDYPMARQEFRNYFEQMDSFNPVVETVFCHPTHGSHVILFTDSKDAETVAKQYSHVIAGYQVTVQIYYPCLDMEPYEMIDYPDPMPFSHLEPMVVNFIQKNPALMKKIEGDLKLCHCTVQWVKQLHGLMLLKCAVLPMDPAAPSKIVLWKEDSVATFMKAIEGIKVKRGLHFADEVKPTMIVKLADFKQDSLEAVMSIGQDNEITVVGKDHAAKELEKHLKHLIDYTENTRIGPGKKLTKMKRVTYVQMMLANKSKFLENTNRRGVEVTSQAVEDSMGVFRFVGKKADVDWSIKQLIKTIESFVVKEIKDLRPIEVQLLQLSHVQERINEIIRTKHVAMLKLSRCDAPEVHGVSMQGIIDAEQIVRQTVCVIGPLRTDTRLDEKCLQFLSQLRCQLYGDKIVVLTDNIRQIEIACMDKLYPELEATVRGYFDDDRIVNIVHDVGKGRIDFMKRFMEQDIKEVTDSFAEKGVVIELLDTSVIQGFQLKGKKTVVRQAIRQLNKMTACIAFSVHPLPRAGSKQYLASPEGMEVLGLLENKFSGVAHVYDEDHGGQECKKDPLDPMERAKFTSGTVKVFVMEGDVVFQKCGALIHFTDPKLNYSTPIGKSIIHVGGFEIQKECLNHVRKSRSLPDGNVFVGSAGNLPCSGIINMVKDTSEDDSDLVISIANCLIAAGSRGFLSVAMTAHGIRAPGDIKTSVRHLVTALGNALRNHQQVEEVFLVDMDGEVVDEIIGELEKGEDFQKCYVTQYEIERGSSLIRRGVALDEFDSADFEPRKLNVRLVVGELAEQKADVIVNSSNEALQLNHGSVSKSLVKAAGESLQRECSRKYSKRMRPGDMAVTSAGDLQCSYVLHTIIAPWDHRNGQSEQMLKKVIEKCLMYADTQKKGTIAFPALGTGFCCFPPHEAARIMFETIHDYERTTLSGCLSNVIVVVYTHDQKSIDAFREQFKVPRDSLTPDASTWRPLLRPTPVFAEPHSAGAGAVTESMRPYSMSCGSELTVEISQGDITEERTDAIVNSIGREYTLDNGMVSKLISETAGPYIKREFMRTGNKQKMDEQGFIVTAGGLLLCEFIIHTRVHSSPNEIKRAVKHCLNEAEKLKLSSVAFPALGTGGKGVKAETVARAMFSGFREFSSSREELGLLEKHVRMVKVVIYQSDMARKFVAATRQERSTTLLSRISAIGTSPKSPAPPVSLQLYTRSSSGMDSFKKAIDTHVQPI